MTMKFPGSSGSLQRRIPWRKREAPKKFPISFLDRVRARGLEWERIGTILVYRSAYKASLLVILGFGRGEPTLFLLPTSVHQGHHTPVCARWLAGWIRPSAAALPPR